MPNDPLKLKRHKNGEAVSSRQVKAPVRWQSDPKHPVTHLAYITDAERVLLANLDMHGSGVSMENPHYGPKGIPSLNGAGDRSDGPSKGGGAAGTGGMGPGGRGGTDGFGGRDTGGGSPSGGGSTGRGGSTGGSDRGGRSPSGADRGGSAGEKGQASATAGREGRSSGGGGGTGRAGGVGRADVGGGFGPASNARGGLGLSGGVDRFGGFNDPFGGFAGRMGPMDTPGTASSSGFGRAGQDVSDLMGTFSGPSLMSRIGSMVDDGINAINDMLGNKQTLSNNTEAVSANIKDERSPLSIAMQNMERVNPPSAPTGTLHDFDSAVTSNKAVKSDFGVQTPTSTLKGDLTGMFSAPQSLAMSTVAKAQDRLPGNPNYSGPTSTVNAIGPQSVTIGQSVPSVGLTPASGFQSRAAAAQASTAAIRDALRGVDLTPGVQSALARNEAPVPGSLMDATDIMKDIQDNTFADVHSMPALDFASLNAAVSTPATNRAQTLGFDDGDTMTPTPERPNEFAGVAQAVAGHLGIMGEIGKLGAQRAAVQAMRDATGVPAGGLPGSYGPAEAQAEIDALNRARSEAFGDIEAGWDAAVAADIARNKAMQEANDLLAGQEGFSVPSPIGGGVVENPQRVPGAEESPPAALDQYHNPIQTITEMLNDPNLGAIFGGLDAMRRGMAQQRDIDAAYNDGRGEGGNSSDSWYGGLLSGTPGVPDTPTPPPNANPGGNSWWHRWRATHGQYGLLGPIPYPQEYFA